MGIEYGWQPALLPPEQSEPFTGHWAGQGFQSRTVIVLHTSFKIVSLGRFIKPESWDVGSWVDEIGRPIPNVIYWHPLPDLPS